MLERAEGASAVPQTSFLLEWWRHPGPVSLQGEGKKPNKQKSRPKPRDQLGRHLYVSLPLTPPSPANRTSTDTLHHITGQARWASNTSCEFILDPCRTVTTFLFVFTTQICTANKILEHRERVLMQNIRKRLQHLL